MNDETVRQLSDRLVATARSVRILDRLSWPREVVDAFVVAAESGTYRLPEPPPAETDVADLITELEAVKLLAEGDTPEAVYLRKTAASYADGARLVAAAGTPDFVKLSRHVFGAPDSLAPGSSATYLELAQRVLRTTSWSRSVCAGEEHWVCLSAEHVRDAMVPRIDAIFGPGLLPVVIDPGLGSKAAASVRKVRLRSGTCFSESDIDQLLEHEVFVHSATAQNGAAQPTLTALGLGAPRTTTTQEGLATFAELITGAMDVSRLRRIALRVVGVDKALGGADYVELVRFFQSEGQSVSESAFSAARICRGATPNGDGCAFTKDAVYLAGLFSVHSFFRKAIEVDKLPLLGRLFAGRMTLQDAIDLGPAFDDGRLSSGVYLPRWIADPRRLAAYLAFSAATNPIDLDRMELGAAGAS